MPVDRFPVKKKRTKRSDQETTNILVEKASRLINEYDPKKDYFIKEFKRKLRDIWRS